MTKEAEVQKLKDIMVNLEKAAVWIGEDGAACVNAKTEEEAFIKFKDLMKEAMGDDAPEVEEMDIKNVGIGWVYLPAKENTEFDWVVDYVKKSPFEVFVYQP